MLKLLETRCSIPVHLVLFSWLHFLFTGFYRICRQFTITLVNCFESVRAPSWMAFMAWECNAMHWMFETHLNSKQTKSTVIEQSQSQCECRCIKIFWCTFQYIFKWWRSDNLCRVIWIANNVFIMWKHCKTAGSKNVLTLLKMNQMSR